jgi:hypothetical protein
LNFSIFLIFYFFQLAKENNTMIIPAELGNVSAMVATAMSTLDKVKTPEKA